MTQKASVKDNSVSIQSNRDVNVGLTFSECERLFDLLLKENFPKLEEAAAKKAAENVSLLVQSTYQKIESRINDIDVKKLAEPDTQATFNDAVQGAAKKGAKIDLDLLSGLLQQRLDKSNDDYLDNCIEEAVKIIPKLSGELISVIPVVHFIQNLQASNPESLDQIFSLINSLFMSKCNNVTEYKLVTLASTGIANYINVTGQDTFSSKIKQQYKILNSEDASAKFPNVISLLKEYDRLRLHTLTLTTQGQIIGTKLLERIFGHMPLEDCIR